MATGTLPNNDYYNTGDTISTVGTGVAFTGTDGSVGFIIPIKKKIPDGATLTVQNLSTNFIVDTDANNVNFTFVGVQRRGENIMLVYNTAKTGAHYILLMLSLSGEVIIA